MNPSDYTTSFVTASNPATVFRAIMDFRAWWSEQIDGHTDQLNETFLYHYQEVHLCNIKLIEKQEAQRLVYLVTDNEFSFVKDKSEWVNTRLVFDIVPGDGQTKVIFTHQGLLPEHECYPVCHDAWTSYIQGSLQSLIATGKGRPNPAEGGLNAELVEKWGLPKK